MKSTNSNTEPGQPCINSSGRGFGPLPGTCRKCRSMSSLTSLNCGYALSFASAARQSNAVAPVGDELAQIVDARPIGPGIAGRGVGKARAREPLAQVGDVGVGDVQGEGRRRAHVSSGLAAVSCLGASAIKPLPEASPVDDAAPMFALADQPLAVARFNCKQHTCARLLDHPRRRDDPATERRRREMAHVHVRADRNETFRQMRP